MGGHWSESVEAAVTRTRRRSPSARGSPSTAICFSREVAPERTFVVGARSYDDAEVDAVSALGVTVVDVAALRDPDALVRAVRACGADRVYIHVDVDVLDPAEVTGNAHPEPFGLTVAELTAVIAGLRAELPLVGSSLAGYSPASAASATDDLGAILRVVGALA